MQRVRKYVYRRESGILWYVRALPKDLRDLPEQTLAQFELPKQQYWRSLGTGDSREANARIARASREFDHKVHRARLATRRTKIFRTEDQLKTHWAEPEKGDLERLVRDWLVAYEDRQCLYIDRPTSEEIADLEATIEVHIDALRSKHFPTSTLWVAETMISEHCLDIPTSGAIFERFCILVLRGQIEVYRRFLDAARSEIPKTYDEHLFHPAIYAQDRAEGPQNFATIAKLADDWLNQSAASDNPKTKALKAHRISVVVEALGPKRKVTSITREECETVLQDVIKRYPRNVTKSLGRTSLADTLRKASAIGDDVISPATQKLYLTNMRSLFGYAVKLGIRHDDPTALLEVKVPRRKVREPFTIAELKALFSAPIFTGCVDDKAGYKKPGPNHPRRHRYWVPVIALYSGMRIDEICQLGADDVVKKSGKWCFRIWADDRDGRHTKTDASVRSIPIHPELIKLGLLEYAKKQKVGRGGLFPHLSGNPNGSGADKLGKWFGRLCESQSLSKPTLVFHSFRHSFRDALRETEAPLEVQQYLGGWTGKNKEEDGEYGRGPSTKQKAKWMSKLKYPGLDLGLLLKEEHPTSTSSLGEENSKTGDSNIKLEEAR